MSTHLEELTVLREVLPVSASALHPEEIADRIVAAVQEGLGLEHLHLLLVAGDRQVYLVPAPNNGYDHT